MARKLMLIVAVLVAVIVMALLVDNHRQGRHIRERYGQLVAAFERGDTNAIQGIFTRYNSGSFLSDVVHLHWRAEETPGTVLILGSSATFWPHAKGHHGFPDGDRLVWVSSNGVWYVSTFYPVGD